MIIKKNTLQHPAVDLSSPFCFFELISFASLAFSFVFIILIIIENMDQRTVKKQAKLVTRKVMKFWRKYEVIDKQAFEKGLDIIIKQVAKQAGVSLEGVGEYTCKVLDESFEDFDKIPDEERTHEDMILIIYFRYLYHIGILEEAC
ncbi:MAG: hypothetical protein SD837_01975 [Candidatus Electrothrix scaldis]|nr:MAG: hypothetical protein SD837_01975 [Candidatus Electrothrix sp. GW3-3]